MLGGLDPSNIVASGRDQSLRANGSPDAAICWRTPEHEELSTRAGGYPRARWRAQKPSWLRSCCSVRCPGIPGAFRSIERGAPEASGSRFPDPTAGRLQLAFGPCQNAGDCEAIMRAHKAGLVRSHSIQH